MAFANSDVSDIIATTIQSRSRTIADNVTKNNALLRRLQQRGRIKTFSGGNVIMQELSFQENANAGWYSGYDLLPVAAQDVISAAQYDIKQAACPVTISGLDQLQNSGRERMIDLMEARLEVAEASMKNLIAEGLYSDGTASAGKQIDGLQKQVAKTVTGTVGGISQSTWAFWKNGTFDAKNMGVDSTNGTSASNIQARFNKVWASRVRGSDRPDLILVDNDYWGAYVASLQAIQRFTSSESAQLGFTSLKFMDADVVLDGGIGGFNPGGAGSGGVAYFLNTNYLFYRPHRDRNMVALTPGRRYSINQDATVQILAWAGNMTSSGLQFQAVMYDTAGDLK